MNTNSNIQNINKADKMISLIMLSCLVGSSLQAATLRNYDVYVQNVVYKIHDKTAGGDVNFNKRRADKNGFKYSGNFTSKIDTDSDVWFHLAVSEKNGASFAETPAFQLRKQICEFSETDKIFFPNLRKYSNIPEKCPWPKGFYHMDNFRTAEEDLPIRIPTDAEEIRSKVDIYFNSTNKLIAEATFYMKIDWSRRSSGFKLPG